MDANLKTLELAQDAPRRSMQRVVSQHIRERLPAELALGFARYEALRRLNPRQYSELHNRNIKGENFDGMVDALVLANAPEWRTAMNAEKRITSKVDSNAVSVEPTTLFGSWLPPESAPLNGTLILGDFGCPWPLPAVWDTYDEQWCVVTLQASPMREGADNYWLETETEKKSQLKRWMPMPSLPNDSSSETAL
jgi:hypothetical protein